MTLEVARVQSLPDRNKQLTTTIDVALDTDQGLKTMKKLMICVIALFASLAINVNAASDEASVPIRSELTYTDYVKARHIDTYNIYYFESGKEVEAYLIGDGDTDLELYVYDENDNLIGSDNDSCESSGSVIWTPERSGYFKIKNLGYVCNCYQLVIR